MNALVVAASLGLLIVSGQGLAQDVPKPKVELADVETRDNRCFIKDLSHYLDGFKSIPEGRKRKLVDAAREIILPLPWLGKDKEEHFLQHLPALNKRLKGVLSELSLITSEEFENVLLVEFRYMITQYCNLPPLQTEERATADSVVDHFELGLKLAIPQILPHDDQPLQETILRHTQQHWKRSRSVTGNYFVLETLYPVPEAQWPDPEKTFVDAAMLQSESAPPVAPDHSTTPNFSSHSKIDFYILQQSSAFFEISQEPIRSCFQTPDQVIANHSLTRQSDEFVAVRDELYQSFKTRLIEKNQQKVDDFHKRVEAQKVELMRRLQLPRR